MIKISRGDVILVLFPDSNLRTAKRRPALVVQADDLQTGLPQVIVSMITSNMTRTGHPSRLEILRASPQSQQTGLRTDSVIMTDCRQEDPKWPRSSSVTRRKTGISSNVK